MGGKYRGMYDKVLLKYTEDMLSCPDIDTRRVFITHTKCDEELVKQVREKVCSLIPFEEVYETTAGCVITSHCNRIPSECFLKLKINSDYAQKLYIKNV